MRTVPAVLRAIDILELVASEDRGFTPAEISAALTIPKSTVHELIGTLVLKGMLRSSPTNGTLTLGVRLLELGGVYASRSSLVAEARRAAAALTERCGEASQVATLVDTEILFIAAAYGSESVRLLSTVGATLPASVTAIGKALLAELSNDVVLSLYPAGFPLPRPTPKSIRTREELIEDLERVREEGVAWALCESNIDICSVGTVVRGSDGHAVVGLSVSVLVTRWTVDRGEQLRQAVVDVAKVTSKTLAALPHVTPESIRR